MKKAALGHYRVRLNGEWIVVPDNAVVTEPNKFGPAVVWPYMGTAYAPAPGRKQRICVCPLCSCRENCSAQPNRPFAISAMSKAAVVRRHSPLNFERNR